MEAIKAGERNLGCPAGIGCISAMRGTLFPCNHFKTLMIAHHLKLDPSPYAC